MSTNLKDHFKEQICHNCMSVLELIVESKEVFKAKILDQIPDEDVPTFNVEFDDESFIEYTVYWHCTKCKVRCYEANKELAFDETFDVLIFPAYDKDNKLGHKGVSYHQYQHPFAPNVPPNDIPAVQKEEKLPTIVKPSTGEVIVEEKEVPVTDPLMEGYGWD